MNAQNLIAGIREKYPEALLASTQPNPFRLFLTVDRENIQDVADYIFNTAKARLILSAGTDKSPINNTYEVTYIFSLDRDNLIVALKEVVPPSDPRVPSLTNIIPGADWHEREMRDLMGIVPEGHPDPAPACGFRRLAGRCLPVAQRRSLQFQAASRDGSKAADARSQRAREAGHNPEHWPILPDARRTCLFPSVCRRGTDRRIRLPRILCSSRDRKADRNRS